MRTFLAFLFVLLLTGLAALYSSAFIVHQNEQALVLRFGKPVSVINTPGLNWKIPIVDTVDIFDKRILDLDASPQEVTTLDPKRLVVDAFARYRIVDPLQFYQALRYEGAVSSRLGPILESALRGVLGSVTLSDIVRDKREELMGRIAQQVNQQAKSLGLEIVDVRIVFDQMKAEREREAAEFRSQGAAEANRLRATADREVTIIKAEATRKGEQLRGEGDAERNRIFAEAYNQDADFFGFYRSMQAYEQAIKAGDTRLILSPDSPFFKYFNDPAGAAPKP
jgi:modulator of FtsH protease HflC